jgi:hypothetical protein
MEDYILQLEVLHKLQYIIHMAVEDISISAVNRQLAELLHQDAKLGL